MLISIHKINKYTKKNKILLLNYLDRDKLLNNISFNINENEVLGLVGESGSGKSILGKILTKVIPPDSGKIYYKDKDITSNIPRAFKRKFQIVFQDPKSILNLKMTVYQIIAEPIISHNLCKDKSIILEKVKELMTEVYLDHKNINTLAGNLKLIDLKKLVFARALSLNPEFIVVDELLSQQDSIYLNFTINLIKNIKARRNISILLISSNLKLILGIVDRVAIFYKGNLIEIIPKDRFPDKGLHPYTELLFNKNNEEVDDINDYLQLLKVKRKPIENTCIFLDRCNYVQDSCYKKRVKLKEVDYEHFVSCVLYEDKT